MVSRRNSHGSLCEFHSSEYVVGNLVYKHHVVSGAGILFLIEIAAAIFFGIIEFLDGNGPRWGAFGLFWACVWPTYFVIAWSKFVWRFRWADRGCDHNDQEEQAEANETNVYHFPSTKFSDK